MNLQPHQRQFAQTYAPAYPQLPQQQQHQQQNFAGPKAPEPCYNCGSPQHVAQHCREARRAVPAGSLNQVSRPQRGGFKKNNSSKPIVTRFAPPPNYTNGPYPQQPLFPQVGPSQPHQQSSRQQPQKQWQQSPQGYGPPAQAWQQQPYVAPTAVSSQAPTYGPHQPQAPQHGYSKPAQSPYPQHQHPYGYPSKSNWGIATQPLAHQQPQQSQHPHYNTAPQVHPQASYIQTQNHQQYPQQQPIQSPYTPVTPQGFPQIPPAQNYHRTHGPQPQQFTQQVATPISTSTSQQQPPPPKPPPCFPNAERIANPTAKSGVIIWRPAQPTETPLAATFVETDEQRALKKSGPYAKLPRDDGKKKYFSKYSDTKGNRVDKDFTTYEVGSEMMRDPAFASVRTGESMVAQPLDFVLPDDPEDEELEEVAVGESANEQGLENRMKTETEDLTGDLDGSSEGTEAGDEQKSNTEKGPGKRNTKMPGIVDGQKVEGASSEAKRSWNRQSNALTQGNNNGARGRNSGNQGKRKSRSPLDNSRPQKHRVREAPVSTPTSSIQPHHHGLSTQPLPPHHPLPPKPVVAPPPPQNFHHGNNNRPQNGTPNRLQGAGNRRNQGYKQRNHPYARRSASPVRHMLVDNQRRDYGPKGKGRGQQQISGG